jgi:hypothetical protein
MAMTDAARLLGVAVPLHAVLSVTRTLGLLVAAILAVWLLKHAERIGLLQALGLTLLLPVILGPVVQPWYLSWGLILLAPVALGRVRMVLVVLSVSSAFIGLPGGGELLKDLLSANPLSVALALLALLFFLTVPLAPWDRRHLRRGDRDGDGRFTPGGRTMEVAAAG